MVQWGCGSWRWLVYNICVPFIRAARMRFQKRPSSRVSVLITIVFTTKDTFQDFKKTRHTSRSNLSLAADEKIRTMFQNVEHDNLSHMVWSYHNLLYRHSIASVQLKRFCIFCVTDINIQSWSRLKSMRLTLMLLKIQKK